MTNREERKRAKKFRKRKLEQQRRQRENRSAHGRQPLDSSLAGSELKLQQRLLSQAPIAWEGELPEDVAVFDDSAWQQLPTERANEVTAVREALEMAVSRQGSAAVERVAIIPRNSPLSDWRLFLRGLVAWLQSQPEEAGLAWSRLDPGRRPGRIAVTLQNALDPGVLAENRQADNRQADNRQAAAAGQVETPAASESSGSARATSWPGVEASRQVQVWRDRLDPVLLHHARLVRRYCFERPLIGLAELATNAADENPDLLIGLAKLNWLTEFHRQVRQSEPQLAAGLARVALSRAAAQSYIDAFEKAASHLTGPVHDPGNHLLRYQFYSGFEESKWQEKALDQLERYLDVELPGNRNLNEPLRRAIASQMHLILAKEAMIDRSREFLLSPFLRPLEDEELVRRDLKAALKAEPRNREAYRTYARWLEGLIGDDKKSSGTRENLEQELARLMSDWCIALPDDVRPRVWLVEHLLEQEESERARPHVEWLANSRQDSPLGRSARWKLAMIEAMRCGRRKTWLHMLAGSLQEVENSWPEFISRRWLPYLGVAYELRIGNSERYAERRAAIWAEDRELRDSLPDACMTLAAAQQLGVPAAGLKPLRESVDQWLKQPSRVTDRHWLQVSAFFWDLYRVGMFYPAYRMHGRKVGKQLAAMLQRFPADDKKLWEQTDIQAAAMVCGLQRCISNGYDLKMPAWLEQGVARKMPVYQAISLALFNQMRFPSQPGKLSGLSQEIRSAAKQERDPYLKFWFVEVADEFDEKSRQLQSHQQMLQRMLERFGFDDADDQTADDQTADDQTADDQTADDETADDQTADDESDDDDWDDEDWEE